jgi:hypothetical protein
MHCTPLNSGTAHPLATYATDDPHHSCSQPRNPSPGFWRGWPRSQIRHPLDALDLEDVFHESPPPPLTWASLLCTHHPLSFLPTLLFSSPRILFFQQSSRGSGRPFFSIATIFLPSLTRPAAVSTSQSTIYHLLASPKLRRFQSPITAHFIC